jgi:hypothetical protein
MSDQKPSAAPPAPSLEPRSHPGVGIQRFFIVPAILIATLYAICAAIPW